VEGALMFHVERSLEILEFNKLLGIIADFAKSDVSMRAVLSISPLNNIEDINKRFRLVDEIRRMSQKGKPLSISPFPDIEPFLHKVRPEGAVLDPIELSGMMAFLSTANSILSQIRDNTDKSFLNGLTEEMTGYPEILSVLKRSIDSEGNILDSASNALKELKVRIKGLENRIRKKLEDITRDERVAAFLQDDFITQRSGRWVIPVRMDSKGQVQGVVHDVSRSGETAFIEPLSIISLSNELENLIAEQKAEEIRILRSISSQIRAVVSEIDAEYRTVIYIDVLNSIALFADMLGMETPQINEQNAVNIVNARHPLLMLAFQKKDMLQQVIPLDVKLGGNNTVMVITGPNAGGKTVTIKTIGLLILMALSGMPIPADSSSSIPFVRNLLVDIGDQQSLESNLSTFSAHVSNISKILKDTDSGTITLIDELGTGTDPDEGAALACAVLKELKNKGALVFATTHLTEIKGFVHKTEGMLNASMEFDQNTLTPLYKLRVGEPGQSHAFETARRYGLSDEIIESAKGILGIRKIELDTLIQDLNEKRRQYERLLDKIRQKEAAMEENERHLKEMMQEAETRQKDIFSNAYKEASEIVFNIKRQMNAFLEEIKKRDRERAKEVIKEVELVQVSVAEKVKEYARSEKSKFTIDELNEGDIVFIKSIGHDATIIKINFKDNRLRVRAGSMEMEVPLSEVGFKKDLSAEAGKGGIRLERLNEAVSSEIDIVGLRVDEALSRLEPFLNLASIAGFSEITVIHGVGSGILSKAVREYLTGHPLVKGFRSGTQQEGGTGVTIAAMS
jgi:DNA mismatch repair protein MutS2